MSQRPAIDPLLEAVCEAGNLARTMQAQVSLSVKQDGTVVTESDLSIHNMLSKLLKNMTPDIPLISEEQPTQDNQRILAESSTFWALDPIDVTANYAAGGDAYSINLALVEQGKPVLGVLHFPGLEEWYFTGDDGQAYMRTHDGATCNIQVAHVQSGVHTAAISPETHATHVPCSQKALQVIFTRGQRRACLVASGDATFCSERAGFMIWDSAATCAIVRAAGGELETHDGKALCYDRSLHLPAYFVGHPELLRHLHQVAPEQELEEIPIPHSNKRKKA